MDVILTTGPEGHSAYAELLANPPEGIRYYVRRLDWRAPVFGQPLVDMAYWKLRGAMRRLQGLPEAAPLPDWGHPIHSAQVILRTRQPWVIDFEHPNALVDFDGDLLARPATRARLARLLARSGAVLPWTEAAARATLALAPGLAGKVHAVLPAIAPRAPAVPEDPDSPLVLFVGRHFHRKGGPEALEAFARARRERCPRARMLVVSNAPPEVRARYEGEGVTFWQVPVPRERVLAEGFAKASVYLMPTHFDTFGMVFLEAFAHAIPVVTADTFGASEIVTHGEDGFVVPGYAAKWFDERGLPVPGAHKWPDVKARQSPEERERIVRDLAEHLGALLADPKLASGMGARGHEKVSKGVFSPAHRNARLRRIYEDAFG